MKHLDSLSGETLDTEIKDWLDPANPHDQACIAKACIALYNHGGGKLILGFDDKTLKPTTHHFPKSVREIYHSDNLCPCIAKFAKPLFEVRVKFEKKNEPEHPIIEVPSGVRSPVVIKSTDKEKKVFSRQNMVITRTLANQTFSSSEPQTPEDWDDLIQTCFDNREADIGRFFRRHLIPIQREMDSLDSKSPAVQILDESAKSFSNRLDAWSKKFQFDKPQIYGLREVAFWIDGKIQSIDCFLDKMLVAQPRLSPWPPFIDRRRLRNESTHPYPTKDGWWEALVFEKIETRSPGTYELDFWRLHPKGKFYHACVYDDDRLPAERKPGQGIEFNLLIRRITEIIAVALAFAKSFGCVEDATSLHFAFRFTGLEERKLCSWYERKRSLSRNSERAAVDNPEVTEIKIPLDLPPTRIWEIVKQVVQPVFHMFAGSGFGDSVFKEIANKTLRGYWQISHAGILRGVSNS